MALLTASLSPSSLSHGGRDGKPCGAAGVLEGSSHGGVHTWLSSDFSGGSRVTFNQASPISPLITRPSKRLAVVAEQSIYDFTVKVTKYHFLVANAKFMFDEEEHFQELMRERLRNFGERNREQDFWLVIEPKFLENYPDITKRLKRPAVALVSTDELWITFMKLRLDRVLRGEIEAETLTEALKSNPVEVNFEKPQIWTAPYTKYDGPWWTPFLPPGEQ